MASTGRSSSIRDRHRKAIARDRPDCGICSEPIDYALPYLHPRSFVVDHIIPLRHNGPDTLENKQAAHRDCNRAKADALEPGTEAPARTFVTSLTW